MAIVSDVEGNVRVQTPVHNNIEQSAQSIQLNPRGAMLTAQDLPPDAELVRLGQSFYVLTTTAVAPVVAFPTTQTGQLTIWNNEPIGVLGNGRAYVIDSLMAMIVTGTTAATHLGMCVMLNKGTKTTLTTTVTALTPGSLDGRAYQGRALFATSTTGLVNDGWMPWGTAILGGAVNTTLSIDIPVKGAMIIPPGGQFTMCAMANTTTTITTVVGLRWHEVILPIVTS